MKKLKYIPIAAFLFAACVSCICAGATITVGPGAGYNFTSIQSAIDHADNGDEIEVGPGTYYEAINFNGKAIRIYSSHGPDDTFINGTGDYHVVQCVSGEGPDTILEGFTITGGNANGDLEGGFGGGMYNVGSSPTVINCIFRANTAKHGGGMYNDTANPILMDCLFEDNSTHNGAAGSDPGGDGGDAGHGGGMYNDQASPSITGCIFRNNKAGDGGAGADGKSFWLIPQENDGGTGGRGGDGAGIYNMNSSPQLEDCTFTGNRTGSGGAGGEGGGGAGVRGTGGHGDAGGDGAGMFSDGGSLRAINCTLSNNVTGHGGNGGDSGANSCGTAGHGGRGAGVYTIRSAPEFIGCHFTENKTGNGARRGYDPYVGGPVDRPRGSGSGGDGAGMYNADCSLVIVTACAFTNNTTGAGGLGGKHYGSGGRGGDGAGICNKRSSLSISDCTFTANRTGNGGEGWGRERAGGRGGHGAGMLNADNADSDLLISRCTFIGNITGRGGVGGAGHGGSGDAGGPGGSGGSGGGIFNDRSHPTVSDCSFIENQNGAGGSGGKGGSSLLTFLGKGGAGGNGGSGGDGAGIRNMNSSPNVVRCTLTRNKSGIGGKGGKGGAGSRYGKPGSEGTDGSGAAMANQGGSVTISDAAFSSNQASRGGGVYNYKGIVELVNCSFRSNGATDCGGGIYNYWNAPTIVGCLFLQNTANRYGSAVYTTQSRPLSGSQSYPVFTNCTISANNGGIETGAIHNDNSDSIITNCILWNNIPGEIHNQLSEPVVTYCNVKGGYIGTGNINVDPLFSDSLGRLSSSSPCAGAGDNSAPFLPDRDLDGNPRIIGSFVDLGAFECTELPIHNLKTDTFYDRIQTAIDDANDLDRIRVLPGTYAEAINFLGKAVHLYSSDGPEVTIINGTGHYHVVQCVGGEGPDTILEGFTITGGNANGLTDADKRGAGMYNHQSSPTVKNCIFKNNSATHDGGGMYNFQSRPAVSYCGFISNTANRTGGGMYSREYSHYTITHSTFSGNYASGGGGAMVNTFHTRPKLINCLFNANMTDARGGAIWNYWYSNATLTHCTFSQNSASDGGGIFNSGPSHPTVVNSVLWGNSPNPFMNIDGSTPAVSYSSIQGGFAGTGNIDADPLFVDAAVANLRLFDGSPCIDAGNNSAVPADLATDLDGDERCRDGNLDGSAVVDMGAFEYHGKVLNATTQSVYGTIQNAITGAHHGDRVVVTPGIYYERINLLGKNISLSSIDPNDPSVVAQTILDGQRLGRVVTFESHEGQGAACLLDGITITGGYSQEGAGIYCFQSSPAIRNCQLRGNVSFGYGSIIWVEWGLPAISGCTLSNNTVYGSIPGEYSGAMVFLTWDDILLKDCTFHNNWAAGGAIRFIGKDWWASLTVVDCSITENVNLSRRPGNDPSNDGGGIYFNRGRLFIEDCYIAGNRTLDAHSSGGGLWIEEAAFVEISRSSILNNQAGRVSGCAGGIGSSLIYGECTIDHCEISGNFAGAFGGGLYNYYGKITNSTICDNTSGLAGGGLSGGYAAVANSVFTNNSSGRGGGLSELDGSVTNCLILANRATSYGGGLDNCTAALANNIIRQNIAATDGDQLYGGSIPNYSNIQDWSGGGIGNITLDPVFRQAGVWVDKSDPNMVVAPDDPNAVWVEGNYRLRPGSPCIDAGDNAAVPAGVATDLNGWSRFIDDLCTADTGSGTGPIVDMGPYEFLPADMDGSGTVNFADFSVLAAHWQQSGGDCAGADMNCDGTVDLADAAMLLAWWLEGGI